MTFREKQWALLNDLENEREQYPTFRAMYDRKILEMKEAIYGSGAGDTAGGSTKLSDVPGGTSQAV
jgi:hypothetical protein